MSKEFDELKVLLEGALKEGKMILQFDLSGADLVRLEAVLQQTLIDKLKSGALISTAPRFEWWQESGVWPIHGEVGRDEKTGMGIAGTIGWTVLIRRVPVQGQVRPEVAAAAAQASKLIK